MNEVYQGYFSVCFLCLAPFYGVEEGLFWEVFRPRLRYDRVFLPVFLVFSGFNRSLVRFLGFYGLILPLRRIVTPKLRGEMRF